MYDWKDALPEPVHNKDNLGWHEIKETKKT